MSAIVQGLGTLANSEGDAFKQQREFDMQKALADARTRLEAAQAQQATAQAGHYNAMADLQREMAQRDRWQPLGAQPIRLSAQQIANLPPEDRALFSADNPWAYPMRDTFHGNIKYVPAGAPATSIESIFAQLQNSPEFANLSPEDQQRLRTMIMYKGAAGSASAATQGQHAVWQQVPGGFQYGIYDAATKKFSPATGVQKGLPQGISTYVDAQGNTHNIQFPSISPAPSQSAGPSGGPPPSAKSPAPRQSFSGSIREYAHAPADVVKQITSIQNEKGLLNDIVQVLEQRDASGQPLWNTDQGASKLRSMWANLLYAHGIQGDETYDQLIQKGVLSGFGGVMGLIPGLRRGDLISQAMSHLPERGDTLRMMFFKAKSLLPVYDRNMTNLLTGAQMNASGKLMNQSPAETIQQLNSSSQAKTATTADVQQYATKYGITYGEALQAFRNEGINVQAAGGKQ